MKFKGKGLAYDQFKVERSVRSIDANGYLQVEVSPISKAMVCDYLGSEIPDSEALGLAPDQIYQLLRDPDELAKGAYTFNGIPLMSVHLPVTPDEPQREYRVGAVGTDARFESPYLLNSLCVWDAESIAGIETKEQCELSAGYRYRADMTPGKYEGTPYHGVMRDIKGNHVCLVPEGRCGSDVIVMDAAIAERKDTTPKEGEKKYGKSADFADMRNKKYPLNTRAHVQNAASRWGDPANRRKYSKKDQSIISSKIEAAEKRMKIGKYANDHKEAGMTMKLNSGGQRVSAVLLTHLRQRMAKDQAPKLSEVRGILLGMDTRLPADLKGKPLAGAASIGKAVTSIYGPKMGKDATLGDVTDLLDNLEDEEEEGDEEDGDALDLDNIAEDEDEDGGAMDDKVQKVLAMLEGRVSPEELEAIRSLLHEGGDAAGEYGKKPDAPKPPVKPVPPALKKEDAPAMDAAAIQKRIDDGIRLAADAQLALDQARSTVQARFGAFDAKTAADAYRYGLDKFAVDHKGIHEPAALKALYLQAEKANREPAAPKLSLDSAGSGDLQTAFPNSNVSKLKTL